MAETHSAILLLGIQSAVAKGKLDPVKVKLHWFQRTAEGQTEITSADLDSKGAYGGEWPEDFADSELMAQDAYLKAVERNGGRS